MPLVNQSIYKNKWTLAFRDAQIEADYDHQHAEKVFWETRSYLPIAMCNFALCAIVDPYALSQSATALLMRFGLIIPVLLLEHSIIALFKQQYLKHYLWFNLFEGLFLNVGMLAVIYTAIPGDLGYTTYFFGLFLIGLWFQSPKFKIWETFYCILISFIGYNSMAIFLQQLITTDFPLLLHNNLYFLLFSIGFMTLAYWREDITKENFYLQYQLNIWSKDLEIKVQQRTTELEIERQKTNKALIDGQEMERNRLGQDLHDDLGGQIISLKHQVELDQQHPSPEKMEALYDRLDDLYQSMRIISKNMLPYTLKTMGLIPAIQHLCITLEKNVESLHFKTTFDPNLSISCPTTQTYLYRIIQELFTNVIKHAHATEVEIKLFQLNNTIKLVIVDNGIGFKWTENALGIGIRNVTARVQLLNGKCHFITSPTAGCCIDIWIPNDK